MLIANGKIITWEKTNRILEDCAILIREGQIVEVSSQTDLRSRNPAEEILDAEGQYVLPGNICAHTHFYGAFSRGMAIPGAAPQNFTEILGKLWWPLDKSLDAEGVQYSTLVCLIDAIRHGTTTLVDHHASPYVIDGSLDIVASAVEQSGLRAALCYEVTDRDGEEKSRAGIKENIRFINKIKQEYPHGGRLAATFGLHASLTLSETTLDACRQVCPEDVGFHIHVAEDIADEYDSLAKTGLRVVERLAKHQILGPNTIAAHAVNVDAHETFLLAESKTWVTHQPRSNMNNAVGVAPVESFLRAGIQVGLGNDGFSNTMWDEWKAAYLLHKAWNRDPRRMNGMDVVQMAVYNNAALATRLFQAPVGTIKPGARADLILVDYHPITPLTAGNLPWHILFGFNESLITATMVDGKLLMFNRKINTLDEEKITRHAQELAADTWKRYNSRF